MRRINSNFFRVGKSLNWKNKSKVSFYKNIVFSGNVLNNNILSAFNKLQLVKYDRVNELDDWVFLFYLLRSSRRKLFKKQEYFSKTHFFKILSFLGLTAVNSFFPKKLGQRLPFLFYKRKNFRNLFFLNSFFLSGHKLNKFEKFIEDKMLMKKMFLFYKCLYKSKVNYTYLSSYLKKNINDNYSKSKKKVIFFKNFHNLLLYGYTPFKLYFKEALKYKPLKLVNNNIEVRRNSIILNVICSKVSTRGWLLSGHGFTYNRRPNFFIEQYKVLFNKFIFFFNKKNKIRLFYLTHKLSRKRGFINKYSVFLFKSKVSVIEYIIMNNISKYFKKNVKTNFLINTNLLNIIPIRNYFSHYKVVIRNQRNIYYKYYRRLYYFIDTSLFFKSSFLLGVCFKNELENTKYHYRCIQALVNMVSVSLLNTIGVQGVFIKVKGNLNKATRTRTWSTTIWSNHISLVDPLNPIDYNFMKCVTYKGTFGIGVWII